MVKWMKEFKQFGIMPHYSDYCNVCNEFGIKIKAERRKLFHLMNSSEADPERIQSLNNSIEELIQMSTEI
jgi:DNA repair ATPase RecN